MLTSMGLLAGNNLLQAQDGSRQLNEVGLILNVLQKELKADWEGTLRKVAAMGYVNLEFNNYYGESAASFKKFLQEVKLKPLAGGSSMAEMKKEPAFNKMVEEAHFFQKEYLICISPGWIPGTIKSWMILIWSI